MALEKWREIQEERATRIGVYFSGEKMERAGLLFGILSDIHVRSF